MTISPLSPSTILLILDDWLRRERFIWIGSAGILLFPCSYLALGGWFTGTTFVIGYSLGLVIFPSVLILLLSGLNLVGICIDSAVAYLEGGNVFTAAASTPLNSFQKSEDCQPSMPSNLDWSQTALAIQDRKPSVVGLCTFVACDDWITYVVDQLALIIPLIAVSALRL